MYTHIISNALFPLHERLKGHTSKRILRELENSQWWSRDKLECYQLERLKTFIEKIKHDIPYYTKCKKVGSLKIETLLDIQLLPITDKKFMRENSQQLLSNNINSLKKFSTGGSTGEPLIFYLSKERVSNDIAAKWRATRWWGVDVGDPEIVLWGSPIELGAQDFVRSIRDKVLRSRLLPVFEMNNSNIKEYINSIKKFKPKMLFGYPSSIALLAKFAKKLNIRLDNVGVKVVFVTAEQLYEDSRREIESTFRCKVANGYGGRDSGFIAHECPSGNMHITAENILLEIVDSDGKTLPAGEIGEIVVTNLATSEYPFLRYRTGDLGILDNQICPCGRTLPLLKKIQGRTTDFIIATNGAAVHALSLIYILREIEEIIEFQIIQESSQKILILLNLSQELNDVQLLDIKKSFKKRLGQGMKIVFESVQEIAREKSGKLRHVKSNISQFV